MTQVEGFEAFAAEAVEDILVRQPVLASSLGDHRFDGRLDDLRPAALGEERAVITTRLAALHEWDDVELPIGHRVDAEVLSVRLRDRLFDIEEGGEYTWNPLVANPGTALYLLLARLSETAWPIGHAIRRLAWHVLDHAWEIEDRS